MAYDTGTLRGALGLGGLLMLVGWRSCCRSEQGARTDEAAVRSVLSAPGQRQQVRRGRVVLQSRITLGAPSREYLVRVFVDVDRRPADVITVYLTSKIAKYWKEEE